MCHIELFDVKFSYLMWYWASQCVVGKRCQRFSRYTCPLLAGITDLTGKLSQLSPLTITINDYIHPTDFPLKLCVLRKLKVINYYFWFWNWSIRCISVDKLNFILTYILNCFLLHTDNSFKSLHSFIYLFFIWLFMQCSRIFHLYSDGQQHGGRKPGSSGHLNLYQPLLLIIIIYC